MILSANCVIFLPLISQGNKGKILILLRLTKAGGFTWHASFKIHLIDPLSSFLKAGGCITADSTTQGCVCRSGFRAAVSISCFEGAATAECLQLLQPCYCSVLGHICQKKSKYETVEELQAIWREGLGLHMSTGSWRSSDTGRGNHQRRRCWGLSSTVPGPAVWP